VYQLSVELPGFKKYVRQGITVLVARHWSRRRSCVGATTDEVTITADAPLLRTESSTESYCRRSEADDLPILGIGGTLSGSAGIRNPYALVQLIPGSTWTPNSLVRMNGTPPNASLRIEVRTHPIREHPCSGSEPSQCGRHSGGRDSDSNYAAEYGQVGGGVFNLTMRSGTNRFHGVCTTIS